MAVTPEEHDAMKRLLEVMGGKAPSSPMPARNNNAPGLVELPGAGQVTRADVNAMADVLTRLNGLTNDVMNDMVTESHSDPDVHMALNTVRNDEGVKVGRYQIMIKEDQKRLAGKQYYSIYNTKTGDVIADDLSLYETAINVVRMLNNGLYVNHSNIRKLFEYDDTYTARKQDAIRYKRSARLAENRGDDSKKEVYESRYQVSIDGAMIAKKCIKTLVSGRIHE